ncbi:MAG: hypothetical protein PHG58_02035 [Clostridia bacterium]|nr:hypothetical protein [Clostridia bacterium]
MSRSLRGNSAVSSKKVKGDIYWLARIILYNENVMDFIEKIVLKRSL